MLIIPTKCKQQKYKCDKYHIYILFNFKIMFSVISFIFRFLYNRSFEFSNEGTTFLQTYHLP